ncbi:MAG: deoxyguanosinetriphosphate triphosphohydrolase [Fimbriimonadaceae bacterium]
MSDSIREDIEARERAGLSPFAALAAESAGRPRPESADPVRTIYMRDRDRVLHSKPFRRLKHKTQVFIDPRGDHYRTRLTHTLEVSQIARTIGRALRLNEDLIEAIALGHDVGHTPFGHAGEFALDDALRELNDTAGPKHFSHSEQSLRVVDVLADLNLSQETRMGIGGHSKGAKDLTAHDGEPTSTLEAAVVRIADRIAYMNHDLDDAVRAGVLRAVPAEFADLGASHAKRITTMVADVIANSVEQPRIVVSPPVLKALNRLKDFLFAEVYSQYPKLYPDIAKAQALTKELFRHYVQLGNLPDGYAGVQGAVDYVAGMTDRFAIDMFVKLRLPDAWRIP